MKKTIKSIFAASVLVALLAVAGFAQQQGPQSLTTTTLSAALTNVGAGNQSYVTLASVSNVYATVEVGTTIWVDTEAMDVVTNSILTNTTTLLVTRGTHGTKSEGHVSGAKVFVSRPNLFQGYDQAGTCWTNAAGSTLPTILPWINLTDGNRYNCKSDGNWFLEGNGSQFSRATTAPTAFCTGTVGSAQTEYLNGAACSGATTATFSYIVAVAGELANLQIYSSAAVVGGTGKDVATVYVNGVATALTCTIAASGTTCSDGTHAVEVAIGSYVQIQFVTATSDTAANISASLGLYGN